MIRSRRPNCGRCTLAMTLPLRDLSASPDAVSGIWPARRARQSHGFRADIQALRGVAILLVLLYHAGVPFIRSGFLGVDVFFVISGYLMTGIIDEALEDGTFTFKAFFARRVRRLLP